MDSVHKSSVSPSRCIYKPEGFSIILTEGLAYIHADRQVPYRLKLCRQSDPLIKVLLEQGIEISISCNQGPSCALRFSQLVSGCP